MKCELEYGYSDDCRPPIMIISCRPITTKILDGEKCPFHFDLSRSLLYRIRSFYARVTYCMSRPAALAAVP